MQNDVTLDILFTKNKVMILPNSDATLLLFDVGYNCWKCWFCLVCALLTNCHVIACK
jgi:hypothetical protein